MLQATKANIIWTQPLLSKHEYSLYLVTPRQTRVFFEM